ncbi:unnamed protein product [Brassica oleracea]
MPPFLFEDGRESVNEIVMESKYGKKKSSSSSSSLFYEAPLGYSIEDVRPNGGIKKFKSLSTPTSVSAWFLNPIVLSSYYKFKQQGDMPYLQSVSKLREAARGPSLTKYTLLLPARLFLLSPTITSTLASSLSPASLSTPTKSS